MKRSPRPRQRALEFYKSIPEWALNYRAEKFAPWSLTVDIVGFGVDLPSADLDALVIERGQPPLQGCEAWPGGFVLWEDDPDARNAAIPVGAARPLTGAERLCADSRAGAGEVSRWALARRGVSAPGTSCIGSTSLASSSIKRGRLRTVESNSRAYKAIYGTP